MANERIFLGLAGGWATEGVAAALIAVAGRGRRMKVRPIDTSALPYDGGLRGRIEAAQQARAQSPAELAGLDRDVGLTFARAAEALLAQAGVRTDDVTAAGLGGQKIVRSAHRRGEACGRVDWAVEVAGPAVVAQELRLPVVAGFAFSDTAAGGHGGPVRAWPDWLMFRDRRLSRVVLHLGGIVSLTFVPSASVAGDVVAFDVGPGTVVLDSLSRRFFGRPCDTDGAIAAKGGICQPLLNELLAGPYFQAEPPKHTAAAAWLGAYLDRLEIMAGKYGCEPAGLVATFTELIARSVADAVAGLTERPHEVMLAGGAAKNITLAARLRALMSPTSTYPVEHYDYPAAGYSAICYAVLAAARLSGQAAHCPQATGAGRSAVLGGIWQP